VTGVGLSSRGDRVYEMKLTEEQINRLYDLIGEKRNKFPRDEYNYPRSPERSFTTWADLEPVKDALEAKGMFNKFLSYGWEKYVEENPYEKCFS
jgi:hypothetical protein